MAETKEIAESRANMYKFLSSVFLAPPSEDFIRNMQDRSLQEDLGNLFGNEVSAELRSITGDPPLGLPEIRQDFMDLFKVPTGSYVTPYEAVYRDERNVGGKKVRGLLMGPSTLEVQVLYKQAGIDIDKANYKELPDHIATELAFMGFLCSIEQKACGHENNGEVEATLRLEREFLNDHLAKWTPMLCDKIRDKATTSLYKGIGTLLENFIQSDMEFLSEE